MDQLSELKKQVDEALVATKADGDDSQKCKYMTFKSGNEFYGLKIQYVNEIIQIPPITAIPRTEDYIKGLINLRGKIIPVIDVRLRFKQEPLKYDERTCIIVVIVNAMTVGLIVEKIADVIEIKEDNILPPPKMGRVERANHRFVYGIARVGNSVKLLLDPDRLLNDEDLSALELSNNNMITMKE